MPVPSRLWSRPIVSASCALGGPTRKFDSGAECDDDASVTSGHRVLRMRGEMGSAALKASLVGFLLGCSQPGDAQVSEELVRGYLWPSSAAEFQDAEARLATDRSLVGVSRMQMHDLEEMLRRGPVLSMPDQNGVDRRALDVFTVKGPGDRDIPVYVLAPSRYTADTEWPLMFAMHGGPPGGAEAARPPHATPLPMLVGIVELLNLPPVARSVRPG